MLKLLNSLSKKEFESDRLRIYDYYYLFINDLENVCLPKEFVKYKHLELNNKYNKVQNPRYTFSQLESVQNLALKALTSFGFIDIELFNKDIIMFTGIDIPEGLINELTSLEASYVYFVTECFEKLSIRELKQRTSLMDYRYELS
jgi:hypothetical protein